MAFSKIKWTVFDNIITPFNLFRLKRKQRVKVLFVLTELSNWKTERLYNQMVLHPKIEPILGITPTPVDTEEAREKIRTYCKEHGYPFVEIDKDRTLTRQTHADIIMYAQPYFSIYYPKHLFTHNLSALFVYVNYAMHTIMEEWSINNLLCLHSWQYYFENEDVANEYGGRMKNGGRNLFVTGVPLMDHFLDKASRLPDPWKLAGTRKKIIYAPHHTIGSDKLPDLQGVNLSTFLEYADFMLELAVRYKDEVYFAFKPHPYLKRKLYTVWGKERTDEYYRSWNELANAQVETGDYYELFLNSDAMIHDCSSFSVEYFYSKNPVLYLLKEEELHVNGSRMFKKAFDAHYHGRSKKDIEQFIVNVCNGNDPLKAQRASFYDEYLIPPGNKTACENIVDSILTMRRFSHL